MRRAVRCGVPASELVCVIPPAVLRSRGRGGTSPTLCLIIFILKRPSVCSLGTLLSIVERLWLPRYKFIFTVY